MTGNNFLSPHQVFWLRLIHHVSAKNARMFEIRTSYYIYYYPHEHVTFAYYIFLFFSCKQSASFSISSEEA
ncbi:hypothetical protein ABD72_21730 [Brevibacillus laterosporus]|nr:hypothetical protein [Brevibacillus laterosporus]TPH23079.1 hypothetical protein EGH09_00825 [Brevibacillus laterosporus]